MVSSLQLFREERRRPPSAVADEVLEDYAAVDDH